jgi:hypothetical protein
MKKLPVLLMAVVFFVAACNNNKAGKNQIPNNKEKDDYGKNDNGNTTNGNTGSTGWTESDKSSSMRDCIASFDESQKELANQICPCVLGKMEKEYASLNEANTKGGEAAGRRLALQCKDEIAGTTDNNKPVGSWSASDENQWMSACTTPLINSMGQQKATSYCSCIMDKLKERYSSYDELNTKGTNEIGLELGKQCIKELGLGQQ